MILYLITDLTLNATVQMKFGLRRCNNVAQTLQCIDIVWKLIEKENMPQKNVIKNVIAI